MIDNLPDLFKTEETKTNLESLDKNIYDILITNEKLFAIYLEKYFDIVTFQIDYEVYGEKISVDDLYSLCTLYAIATVEPDYLEKYGMNREDAIFDRHNQFILQLPKNTIKMDQNNIFIEKYSYFEDIKINPNELDLDLLFYNLISTDNIVGEIYASDYEPLVNNELNFETLEESIYEKQQQYINPPSYQKILTLKGVLRN